MSKKNYLQGDIAETIIIQGVHVRGDITSDNDISIDGHIEGNVKTTAMLRLGHNARVIGDIAAGNIQIAGIVEGNIVAAELLTCESTANIKGDITTPSLTVDSGAVMLGSINMPTTDFSADNQEE